MMAAQTRQSTAFRAQMALYDTFDALMCQAFSTMLQRPAQMWNSRLRPSSILCFEQLAKEFEMNFLASAHPKPTTTSLLKLSQKDDVPLAQFVARFMTKTQGMPNAHPSLANQYVAAETLVPRKREDQKRPRAEQARGQSSRPPRRMERAEPPLPSLPPTPLNYTRT
ncbi:hypothetical protein BHE74_00033386 [Ensete ventricosum]|nr:hypothetical protein BHE74_00033386 [Ensete ventricosum]